MNKRLYFYIFVIMFVAFMYSLKFFDTNFDPHYKYNDNPAYMVDLTWDKPFIFRILMMVLARSIYLLFGLTAPASVASVIIISSVFMFFSLLYFFEIYLTDPILPAFVCVMLAALLTSYYRKIYDFSTIGFFCIALSLLARNKIHAYHLLFPLATFNRETTFLLMIFFMVYFLGRLPNKYYLYSMAYQGCCYVLIKIFLSIVFIHNGGKQFAFEPMKLIKQYSENPVPTIILLILLIGVVYLLCRQWDKKPAFLQTALLAMFPLQILLHLLMGYAFEIRVLAESLPIVFLICAPKYLFKDNPSWQDNAQLSQGCLSDSSTSKYCAH
jgi:hypothetical protein